MSEDQRITLALTGARNLQAALEAAPDSWQLLVPRARTIILALDGTTFMQDSGRIHEQTRLVEILQDLAYYDADEEPVEEIADWCMRSWLLILQHHPQNIRVLTGIGRNWLLKAQPALSRIQQNEGHSSSSNGSWSATAAALGGNGDENHDARAIAEAEGRLGLAESVEARGILLPATEFLVRAIRIAEARSRISGELLATAADALISLGTVSYPRGNEQYFRQALLYLRQASRIRGYHLDSHLQEYYDEYARFLD